MKTLHGIMASPGIAIGEAFCHADEKLVIPQYDVPAGQLESELQRFRVAAELASNEVRALKTRTSVAMRNEEGKFLDSHILMINDPGFEEQIKGQLHRQRKNVEWVLLQVVEEMTGKLSASDDTYFRDRIDDIDDISRRILRHLLYRESVSLASLDKEVILVAHNLMPSDAIGMNKDVVRGIAMDAGGKTSHTAILARSFEIPAVLGLSEVTKHVSNGDEVIIDGNSGTVIIRPDEDTKLRYARNKREWQRHELDLQVLSEFPAETRDGKLVSLEANIEVPEEMDSVLAHGADGIGLYRSEFLFLQPNRFAGEEEQYRAYRRVLEAMGARSVTIRTLDLGGDKVLASLKSEREPNPILGWRAIRFCLSMPDIFKTQLRALYRASIHGNLRIMFPMISSIEELDRALEAVDEVKEEMARDGIPHNQEVPIGAMIEVPSAAFTTDVLARKVSFFSIGTNDLIQYTIAVDRGNERIAYLYEPFHPGVLRMIRMIIANAHAQEIPVGMCGEMAGEPLATVVLLGLGLDEFSMSAISIPEIKKIIRNVALSEAEDVAARVMEMTSHREVGAYLRSWVEKNFGFYSG